MGCLIKSLLFAGSLVAGYSVSSNLINKDVTTDKYKIIQKDEMHYLKSKELDKSYILQEVNKEVYMGDLEHLVNGVVDLSMNKALNNTKGDKYEK